MNNGACAEAEPKGFLTKSLSEMFDGRQEQERRLMAAFGLPSFLLGELDSPSRSKTGARDCSLSDFRKEPGSILDEVILGGTTYRIVHVRADGARKAAAMLLPDAEWLKLKAACDQIWELGRAQASERSRKDLHRQETTPIVHSTALARSDPGRILDLTVYAEKTVYIDSGGDFARGEAGKTLAAFLPICRYNELVAIRDRLAALTKDFEPEP
jgi:hypothetical protein